MVGNLILTILMLCVMVVIHELGHFLFAKLFGVKVLEFSIGMGPALYTTNKKKKAEKDKKENSEPFDLADSFNYSDRNQKKENDSSDVPAVSTEDDTNEKTTFSIRAFPIGGYVSMLGEDGNSKDARAFCNKKPWQKIIISLAGPAMNFLLGILCMCLLVGIEANINEGRVASNTVGEFINESYGVDGEIRYFNSKSDECDNPLMVGDKIIKVEDVRVHTGNEVVYEISHKAHNPIDITVIRNGEKIELNDVVFPTMESQGIIFGDVDFRVYGEELSFGSFVKHAFFRSFSTIKMVIDSISDMLTGRYGIDAVSGPVGVSSAVGDAVSAGFHSALYLFTVITMNLGVMNLLPLPALDGGHLIFHFYELIFRKPVKKEFEQAVNVIGFMLLMALALFITVKDVLNLF